MTSPFIQVHIKNGMCEFAYRSARHSSIVVLIGVEWVLWDVVHAVLGSKVECLMIQIHACFLF